VLDDHAAAELLPHPGRAEDHVGPISYRSVMAVSGSSGKLTVKPMARAVAMDIICSPIQGRGKKETNSSSGFLGSTAEVQRHLEHVAVGQEEPLGKPVVPEV
jgi:hypothetical protein